MKTTDIRGIKYAYDIVGQGEAALLAHCLTWNRHDYDYQTEALQDAYTLILPDQRGHGNTGFPAQPYSLNDMAEDLYLLVQKLGVGPVHYVGHSMGAMMGPYFALAHPEALRSMTLIGGSAITEPAEQLAGYRQLVGAVRAGAQAQVIDRLIGLFFSEWSRANRQEAIAKYRADFLASNSEGMYWTAEAVFTRDNLLPRLPEITVPTLVIVGEKDVVTSPERAQELVDGIPNARLLTVENAGHFTPAEAPAAVNNALREFWASV